MSTVSIITVRRKRESKEYCAIILNVFSGYLSGVGSTLKERFGNHTILNGIQDQTDVRYANDMQDLSAQIVSVFKNSIGGCYLMDTLSIQEYNYHLYENEFNKVNVEVTMSNYGKDKESGEYRVLYEGPLKDLDLTLDTDNNVEDFKEEIKHKIIPRFGEDYQD